MGIADTIFGMKRRMTPPKTHVTLSEPLLAEAKALGVSVAQAAEAGVARAVAEKRAANWAQENREAIRSSNDYVEQNGLPLAKYRHS